MNTHARRPTNVVVPIGPTAMSCALHVAAQRDPFVAHLLAEATSPELLARETEFAAAARRVDDARMRGYRERDADARLLALVGELGEDLADVASAEEDRLRRAWIDGGETALRAALSAVAREYGIQL